jgi:cytochrome c oxidase assembly factor CtaG
MSEAERRRVLALVLMYGAASLVHFIHNAELIREYPGLPATWTRGGVYLAWLAMTAVGVCGWRLLSYGYELAGLLVLAGYAFLGLDSLGHYVAAPFSAHTAAMNVTILMEVAAAAFVIGLTVKLIMERMRRTATRQS